MKQTVSLYLILIASLCAGMTYAAGGGKSLWGDIDDPQENVDIKPEDINAPPAPKSESDALANLKTTCEIIRSKTNLDPNVMKTSLIIDALRNSTQLIAPEYKAMLNNPTALNDLYVLFRQQYLKKYC